MEKNGGDGVNIFQRLKEKSLATVDQDFYKRIEDWDSWYRGDVKGFHNFQIFTGQGHVRCRRFTMNMGKKVAQDWANLLMNEKVSITLEGTKEQAFFDQVCEDNNFAVKINEMQELKAGLGTAAYVCRITEASLDPDTSRVQSGGSLRLDYVTAPHIFPLSWENGRASECAFTSCPTVEGEKYLYLQAHRKGPDGLYIIENSIFRNNSGELTEVPLASVKGYEAVAPRVKTYMSQPLFVLDRLNIVNNVDETLPMGVPAFANAIDQLKAVDISFDSYVNEFVLGKKRIMVKPAAVRTLDGDPVFDANDVVFYVLPEDTVGESIITPIDMSLRVADHNAGMQDMLNALGSNCGFGENHYQYDRGSVTTATQIVSENSTLFRTIKKHEIILEETLTQLARTILRLGNKLYGMGLNEEVEISIDFDDSIIEDKQSDFSHDMQLLNAGIMNDWEFRMKWMNEDEATARKMLPKMEDMTEDQQNEVE